MTDRDFIRLVKGDLIQGLGVHDIEVRHGIDPDRTRELISAMDNVGALDLIYDRMRLDMRTAHEIRQVRMTQ